MFHPRISVLFYDNLLIPILFSLVFLFLINEISSVEPLKKITEHKLSVDPPVLTEEESKSRFIPENFRCDACKAVAFQFHTAFDDFNKFNKQHKYNIPEYELLDLIDKICDPSTYKLYGIKEIKGMKKLSGDGLPSRDVPVVMSGGGMWPGRLSQLCQRIIEDVDEEEIYRRYKEETDDIYHLQKYLCFETGVRGDCKKEIDREYQKKKSQTPNNNYNDDGGEL